MLQMARAEQLDEGTRHLAIEFVITIQKIDSKSQIKIRKLKIQNLKLEFNFLDDKFRN